MRLSRSISYLSFCSLDGGIGGGRGEGGGGGIQEWEIGFDVGGEREGGVDGNGKRLTSKQDAK
jgi:hypothetical protein